MNRLTVSVPGPIRRVFEGLRHRVGGRGSEQTKAPWEAGASPRGAMVPPRGAPAQRLVGRLYDGSRRIVGDFLTRSRTGALVGAMRRRYAFPGVALGLTAGLQWSGGSEVGAMQFDEIGRNLQEIFRSRKAYQNGDMVENSLMMRIEEGTCVDALEDQESECWSVSGDSDFVILEEDVGVDSSIGELSDDQEYAEMPLALKISLVAVPISSSVVLRELLETAEHQRAELSDLAEAAAQTNVALNALREAMHVSLKSMEADMQQTLEQLSEPAPVSLEASEPGDWSDVAQVASLVDRQEGELDELKGRVAWQHRLLKQMLRRVQVQPANATPTPFCQRDAVYLNADNQASFEFIG